MKLEFDFQRVIQFTNPLEGPEFEKLKRSLLTVMIRQKDKLFQESKDPSGTGWKPLSLLVAASKNARSLKSDADIAKLKKNNTNFDQHKILIDTGALKNSLTSTNAPYAIRSVSGSDVTLGTNLPYAAIQNFGGKIQRNGYTVEIPARPFIGFGAADNAQIQEKIQAVVKKIGVKK